MRYRFGPASCRYSLPPGIRSTIQGCRRGSILQATRVITSAETPMSMANEATLVFYRLNAHRFLFLPFLFLLTPEIQTKDPGFVLAPQVENTKTWARPHVNTGMPGSLRVAFEILDAIEKEYSIDRDREYIAGQSMGGEGGGGGLALDRR